MKAQSVWILTAAAFKTPVFSSNETKYERKMDEETRATIRNASTAGMVGHAMTSDKDYRTQLGFRCE